VFSGYGFSISGIVVYPVDCDRLIADLSPLPRSRAGARHLMSQPLVRAIAHDDRLLTIAQSAVGPNAVPFRATLFDKSPATNWLIPWHQDTALPLVARFEAAGWGPWSRKGEIHYAHAPAWALERVIALRLHLDASDSGNGPLRVIPGSHCAGVLSDAEVADVVERCEAVECLVPRGGVLAMRPLLVHSSSKVLSDAPRRVLHIEYADALELGQGIRLAIA
jgi:ectoine hydroxylase-related dioxygenase (phytanoyl-CoA dioxygenase family)